MRRLMASSAVAILAVLVMAAPALACAGLVAPNGSVRLLRTATLAGYHQGIEHYITSFEFQGGGAKFGSIVPLPDVPSKVTRGGRWTLQRLAQETQPQPEAVAANGDAAGTRSAEELYETEIDGLLITILKGGSRAVGRWAKDEGFALTPDAPQVLRFYAQRSKIFMAARFVPKKSQDKQIGDGVPIHLRIPTDNPWVPLRILALGKNPDKDVKADVYLLTHGEPTLLPEPQPAGKSRPLVLEYSQPASDDLLDDLRSDRGMKWIPGKMWLSYLRVLSRAKNLTYDLSVGTARGGPYEEEAYGAQNEDSSSEPTPEPTSSSTSSSTTTPFVLGWLIGLPLTIGTLWRIRRHARRTE